MVSRGHLFPARLAILCYQRQVYPNRELVIVSAHPASPLAAYVEELQDPSIRFIAVPPMSLGELRNRSVAEARGSLLCIWDDDDLYHRYRLERQVANLLSSGAAANFLSRVLLWWPERRALTITGPRSWENTMLTHRGALPEYPSLALREDSDVVARLLSRHEAEHLDQPDLYCYIVHPHNTCDSAHFEHIVEESSWVYPSYEEELARLSANFPLRWYGEELIARARGDGVLHNDATGPLLVCADRSFGPEAVQTDGVYFLRCRFDRSILHYLGGRVPRMEDCRFDGVEFKFGGSAANTVIYMRQLLETGVLKTIA